MLAIIPARGGSKRIPGKNIRPFLGRPIIEYSIRAALAAGCFTEVMVSTDSEEIAEVARAAGASVPFMRSDETADDFATTADVVREVLDRYAGLGQTFEAFAVIYATAPFLTADTLTRGKELLDNGHAAAFTCVEYSYPIQRALRVNDGLVAMINPQYATARSQDLEKSYHDAGQCYFSTTEAFREHGTLWGPDTAPILLSDLQVQDIDTPVDWQLAELKYRLLFGHGTDSDSGTDSGTGDDDTEEPKVPDTARYISDMGPFRLVNYTDLDAEASETIRRGRNLPEIRERMLDTTEISEETHSRFVESLRNRDDKAYYACYYQWDEDSEPMLIGSVTLTRIGDDSVERGIWLLPEAWGQGYARALLARLYQALARTGVRKVYTRVRRDNAPSMALENALDASPITLDEVPDEMRPLCDDLAYYERKLD